METPFNKIEEILTIPDKGRRFQELEKCAAQLGVLSPLERKFGNKYNEQQLAIAIYDGYQTLTEDKRKGRRFVVYVLAGLAVMIFLLVSIPKAVTNYMRVMRAKKEKMLKVYTGIDEKGKVVKDDQGQPVLFHDMEGYYEEYYNDGSVHYDYLYSAGQVVEKREYNKKGDLIAHFVYDKDGNPTLVKGD